MCICYTLKFTTYCRYSYDDGIALNQVDFVQVDVFAFSGEGILWLTDASLCKGELEHCFAYLSC